MEKDWNGCSFGASSLAEDSIEDNSFIEVVKEGREILVF